MLADTIDVSAEADRVGVVGEKVAMAEDMRKTHDTM
jgi:hypothetical protein